VESLIRNHQEEYYRVLAASDKSGTSTPFLEFMLGIILQALEDLLQTKKISLTTKDRISHFREVIGKGRFSRKDYLNIFRDISQPTASRDLKWAVEQEILLMEGEKKDRKSTRLNSSHVKISY